MCTSELFDYKPKIVKQSQITKNKTVFVSNIVELTVYLAVFATQPSFKTFCLTA